MKFKWLCCADTEESIKQSEPTPLSQPSALLARRISTFLQKNSETLNHLVKPNLENSEASDFPILNLQIEETITEKSQSKYRIFHYGLENSETHSGIVYFRQDSNSELIVSSDSSPSQQSLCIFFDHSQRKYFIKDLDLTTFVKIQKSYQIEARVLISFIDKRIIVAADKTIIRIKAVETDESFEFTDQDSPITVGRSETCSVKIFGKNISRVQCTFYYEQGWVVKDGGNSASLNGTWFMPIDQTEVVDGMIFNANKTIFSVKLENHNV